jgi:hypothetical protein
MTSVSTVWSVIASHHEIADAVTLLDEALEDAFLVGGAVRDALLGFTGRPKDLDIICSVSNLNRIRTQGLAEFQVGPNRHGNLRLARGALTIDIFAPETFYGGFESLEGALRHFDVNLNAVAVSLHGGGNVVDPLSAGAGIQNRTLRLVQARWDSTKDDEDRTVLLARLLKLWRRIPYFRCENADLVDFDIEVLFMRYQGVLEHHLGAADPEMMALELRSRLAGK